MLRILILCLLACPVHAVTVYEEQLDAAVAGWKGYSHDLDETNAMMTEANKQLEALIVTLRASRAAIEKDIAAIKAEMATTNKNLATVTKDKALLTTQLAACKALLPKPPPVVPPVSIKPGYCLRQKHVAR